MDQAETVDTQLTLPTTLYEAIEERAQVHGHSVSHEIVRLLSLVVPLPAEDLEREFAEWEAASDEDWQALEVSLASESH